MLHGYGASLLEGSLLTLAVAFSSLVIALVLGLFGAVAKLSRVRPLRWLATAYTTLIRGVPDLVMMLLIFYGGQVLINKLGDRFGWGYLDIDPFVAGVLTIGFIFGAYIAEVLRGAILAVPAGQREAAARAAGPVEQLAGDGQEHGHRLGNRPVGPDEPRRPGGRRHARTLHVLPCCGRHVLAVHLGLRMGLRRAAAAAGDGRAPRGGLRPWTSKSSSKACRCTATGPW
jgi:His/Glu/Gln/Arg/opine family amino acid ABC transporter permease subunit